MKNTERSLGELVTTFPMAAKVFQQYQLDYCCGGKQSLADACAKESLDPETVLTAIEAASRDKTDETRWDQRPLPELVQHILDRYHAPLRTELPRLIGLATKVEAAHAEKPTCPKGLTELLTRVARDVENHLAKEEQILFPLIVAGRGRTAHMPVQVMMREHDDHGEDLRAIREITNQRKVPEDACATWRELYRALGEFETELMDHIHLENNILFPRALAS
ncbi:MAG TPA: iron-sulfur cluster repair protein YtfE [Polyangiaceae bacterium]|jgi:regulator of cell morphogenesis and NO signaling|nr:MAG: Iron-sulfur cluster repair protein YtfE [Deltaproteobacteria bacterium ADurb.Bin207]HNS96314.1 iron-sulfur cluster repair protein YtfE [Polyangiaceae bacterium]HNZ22046.1 iron-sulfur cluster repair protein YtfE [Polyangiaceae bacterium]HOD22198.1 iron-sulfur cluster repair protein YtfE [Polyangiaceae bacterium]HOE47354.1 iron-sulfur cluster repair protein YtfE [Polyangiaceae bacterium]